MHTELIGRHQRQGRRRRRGKAVVLIAIFLMLVVLLAPSVVIRKLPKPSTHKGPTRPDPVFAANMAWASPGYAEAIINMFSDFSWLREIDTDEIMGGEIP